MEEVKDDKTHKSFIDRLTLGVIRVLDEVVPVGSMIINNIALLRPLIQSNIYSLPNAPSLSDLDFEDDLDESNIPEKPHFDTRSRIFELDACNGNGKVCLVYKSCSPGVSAQQCEIWFLDRSLFWHFISTSFIAYYRLMITHLGLPEWQYNFTPFGPSPQAKQWAALYQPLTFHVEPNLDTTAESVLNKLDPAKAFRGKTKPSTPKKKQTVPVPVSGGSTSRTLSFSGRHAGTKR
ncbi:hypothetical protein DNTS_003842 [Danionella cerebrum]|uniref:Knr4/Smi1-like domain-containing protein n=1 Tax=Danionella cerebrum TaxID=2873325 RepID=A0A553QYT9_9TELE|nr:hypothetical protein DNTS_003842 [Danionella translucida]